MSVWVLERGNMNQAVLSNKQALVTEICDKIKNSQSTVVCEYRGLSVACDDLGFEDLKDALVGPNAFAFSEDATAPARILAKYAKKHKALVLKKGIVEGKVVDEATVKELSLLPGRDGMLSMLLSCLQAPVSSFARVVKAVAEAKESGTAAPAEEAAPAAEAAPAEEAAAA